MCMLRRIASHNNILLQDDLLGIKEQLLQEFSPDDAFPLGVPLFMETPRPCSPVAIECLSFNEVISFL